MLFWCACAPNLQELTSGEGACVGSACDAGTAPLTCGDDSFCDASSEYTSPVTDASAPSQDVADGARDGGGAQEATDAAPHPLATDSAATDGPSPVVQDAAAVQDAAMDVAVEAGGSPPGLVLFTFDLSDAGGTDGGENAKWRGYGSDGTLSLIADDSQVNNPQPGALAVHLVWRHFGDTIYLETGFPSPYADYSAFSRLHISIKVPASAPALDSVLPYISDVDGKGVYAPFRTAASVTTGRWIELISILPFGPTGPFTRTAKIGVQFRAVNSTDDAATAPPPLDIELDNVWLD